MRGIWGDSQRYQDTYWCKWDGKFYFPGDGARVDSDGYYWILGRVDDVVNVSGHRIGTAELESLFVGHSNVVEAAVIGAHHEIKGQCLVAFVTLKAKVEPDESVIRELNDARGRGNREVCDSRAHHFRLGSAENPLWQNHAAIASGHCRRSGYGECDHPGRSLGCGCSEAALCGKLKGSAAL
jgi:acyl-CoA synthetase (AMP-forming)/AMP-acid ligase II